MKLCCFALLLLPCALGSIITDYGAIANDSSNAAAYANTKALQMAIAAANSSSTERTAVVPPGNFYFFNATFFDLHNVTLEIRGTLTITNNITEWKKFAQHSGTFGALVFLQCDAMTLTGGGVIDGQGYDWWVYTFTHPGAQIRPHMVVMSETTNIHIYDLTALNSPQFHFRLYDVRSVYIHDVTIQVDVTKQKALHQQFGTWKEGLPTFPLNTDGIDPSGQDVLIERVSITNFDDAVAVKPAHGGYIYSNCSRNITVRNSHVHYGVGLTIGSVPPNAQHNCVQGVLFENVQMHTPIKAIYIKTNPGTVGTGLIDGITYRNITGDTPLWYPIYIGPQQQRQPGTAGTGCSFFYPIVDKCPTNPLVPISNVVLDTVHFTGGLTLPGIILCNETRPCTDFQFTNVVNDGSFIVSKDYVCKNADVSVSSGTSPAPSCSQGM